MRLWLSVLAVAVANAFLKAGAPLVLGRRPLPAAAVKVTGLTAPVLLAGLIITDVAGRDWQLLNPAQLLGLAVAALARLAHLPMLLALLCGIVATAVLRWTGMA